MAKSHLTNDEFFVKLGDLFLSNGAKGHGSIFLSQKRLTHGSKLDVFTGKKGQVDLLDDLAPEAPLPVIVRATNGDSRDRLSSKIKLSTVVNPDALDAFYLRYADTCRTGMSALKKRDRRTQKQKARKRKVAAEGARQGA